MKKATLYTLMTLPTPQIRLMRLINQKTVDVTQEEKVAIIKRKQYQGQLYLTFDDNPTVYQVDRVINDVNPQFVKLVLSECTNEEVINVIHGGGGVCGRTN